MVNGYSEAIKSLWKGLATVTVLDGKLNPSNGRTYQAEKILFEDQPCRVSHSTVKSTDSQNGTAVIAQSAVLYIDPQLEIPEGSKIRITQNNITKTYTRSGSPAVYTAHQEIPIELYKERA